MNTYDKYLRPLFFGKRFYRVFATLILVFILSYLLPFFYLGAVLATIVFGVVVLLDYLNLFLGRREVTAVRILPERFSNGDLNTVKLELKNNFPFRTHVGIIDEVPVQFQKRDFWIDIRLLSGETQMLEYTLRPVERGEYVFQRTLLFVKSPLGMVVRRFAHNPDQMVKVLPSYLLLKQFELLAHSNHLSEAGSRKIRKIGHSLEFEQIKEYVPGDDIRTLNWKATARRGGELMVNSFVDERSQQVYCIIDKGRVMKMPFEGMSLLDYAVNATLMLSRVALIRQDRAGLVSFDQQIGNFIPADRKASQMTSILETLYNQQTRFLESDYEKLYALVRTRITQRSLLVLFSNFESLSGLQRQLPYIRSMARSHLMLVVFFENTELRKLTGLPPDDIETLYTKTIAEKFATEKRLIVKELQQHGILTILSAPRDLTIHTVNKYLELKARQAI